MAGAPAAVGDVLAGRWSVFEVRRGGQAWVLIAEDLKQAGRRAIKIPLSGAGALSGDAELATLLGLEPHPHVVSTLDVVELAGRRGIVLEYAPGTLADLLGRARGQQSDSALPLPEHFAVLLQQVCDGMAHLSASTELAHLDLKPSNILLDDAGRAKVADFGLAQQVLIRDGHFLSARGGTWAYAAPEVLRGEPCDVRADIFSFGVLLYEVYTGALPYPFQLKQDPGIQRAQLLDYYASPDAGRRTQELYYWGQGTMTQVPIAPPDRGISTVLSACLDEYMSERPPSFQALAALLARALRRPPLHAEPTTLSIVDRLYRDLALSRVLIRLGRLDEAVNRLNRMLALPMLPWELRAAARQTAQEALTQADRTADAAALEEWG